MQFTQNNFFIINWTVDLVQQVNKWQHAYLLHAYLLHKPKYHRFFFSCFCLYIYFASLFPFEGFVFTNACMRNLLVILMVALKSLYRYESVQSGKYTSIFISSFVAGNSWGCYFTCLHFIMWKRQSPQRWFFILLKPWMSHCCNILYLWVKTD